MLAVDADIVCDVGAYSTHPFTCGVEPLMAATEMLGPYKVAHYRCRTRAVATNKAPMAPYRGVVAAADGAGHGAADGEGGARAATLDSTRSACAT